MALGLGLLTFFAHAAQAQSQQIQITPLSSDDTPCGQGRYGSVSGGGIYGCGSNNMPAAIAAKYAAAVAGLPRHIVFVAIGFSDEAGEFSLGFLNDLVEKPNKPRLVGPDVDLIYMGKSVNFWLPFFQISCGVQGGPNPCDGGTNPIVIPNASGLPTTQNAYDNMDARLVAAGETAATDGMGKLTGGHGADLAYSYDAFTSPQLKGCGNKGRKPCAARQTIDMMAAMYQKQVYAIAKRNPNLRIIYYSTYHTAFWAVDPVGPNPVDDWWMQALQQFLVTQDLTAGLPVSVMGPYLWTNGEQTRPSYVGNKHIYAQLTMLKSYQRGIYLGTPRFVANGSLSLTAPTGVDVIGCAMYDFFKQETWWNN